MNNIIIPIVNEQMLPFVEIAKKEKDTKVIIGIIKSLSSKFKKMKGDNFALKIFEDGSKIEEIINALQDELDEGKVVICRKAISKEELSKFIQSKDDINICKEKRNKFQDFFFKIWQKFMNFLFGFVFFDGDISVISFDPRLFDVLINAENLSYISRVNKWKGVNVVALEVAGESIKKEYNKTKVNLMFYGWIALFLAVVASAVVYFYFVRGTFLNGLLYACAILLALTGMIVAIAIFNLHLRIGQRVFNKAKVAK